jgi:hypothetical protein
MAASERRVGAPSAAPSAPPAAAGGVTATPSPFPELSVKNALLGVGSASLAGLFYFWRRKQTVRGDRPHTGVSAPRCVSRRRLPTSAAARPRRPAAAPAGPLSLLAGWARARPAADTLQDVLGAHVSARRGAARFGSCLLQRPRCASCNLAPLLRNSPASQPGASLSRGIAAAWPHPRAPRDAGPPRAAPRWPTLGGGIMLAVQPDEEQLAKVRGGVYSVGPSHWCTPWERSEGAP